MFRIKICGLTTAADAERAVSCGADAVGLNFFRGSRRHVREDAAREIVEAVGSRAEVVAVFVDEEPGVIADVCGRLGIRRVQLHGREAPDAAARIRLWRMKAVHASLPVDLEALREYPCEAFLLDAGGPGEYGGTGKSLPWSELPSRFGRLGKPWILAGGLTPENVERAIVEADPFGVDTASGVESSPGRKDPDKMAAFVENAKRGFLRAGR
jgi:phosphoribosylanthranilate isomerase